MTGDTTGWRRMVFVLPFVVIVVLAVAYACDAPRSGNGARTAPPPSTPSPAGPTGSPSAPAPAPATDAATGDTDADPPSTQVPSTGPPPEPMDGLEEAPPSESPVAPPPAPAQVDMQDPAAVSRAAVLTMWTYDTAKDSGPIAAARRAAPFFSPGLAEAVRSATDVRPPQEWAQWAEYQARTTVTAVSADEAGKPPNTPTAAYQAWALTVVPVGADGWRGVPQNITVYVTLSRAMAGQPWQVAEYQVG